MQINSLHDHSASCILASTSNPNSQNSPEVCGRKSWGSFLVELGIRVSKINGKYDTIPYIAMKILVRY